VSDNSCRQVKKHCVRGVQRERGVGQDEEIAHQKKAFDLKSGSRRGVDKWRADCHGEMEPDGEVGNRSKG